MTENELLKILRARGIIHQVQRGFRGLVANVDSDVRIVCAEQELDYGFVGVSFWLYGEGETWFLGLWSGVRFRINRLDAVEEMIVEIFSGKIASKGTGPYDLSTDFRTRYGLEVVG
jgi:hypothetical protein